jgi:hypothetical protein
MTGEVGGWLQDYVVFNREAAHSHAIYGVGIDEPRI